MQVTSKHTMRTKTKLHPEPYQEPPPVQAMKIHTSKSEIFLNLKPK